MTKTQLKELIREEYHNVKDFMEDKYGFTPELGKVIDNPYVSSFKNEATYSSGLYMILDKDGKVVDKGLESNMWYSFEKYRGKGTHYIVSKKNLSKAQSLIKKYQSDLSNTKFRDSMFKLYKESVSTEALSDYEKDGADYEQLYKDYLYSKKRKTEGDEVIDEYDVDTIEETTDFINFMKEYSQMLNLHKEQNSDIYALNPTLDEAEYQGRDVKLGKPMQGDVKKFKVYVKNPKGNVVKVNFGHGGTSAKGKTMSIKKNDPARRKAFRARHNCDNPGPRHKARYWSCRKW
jgi:hypothetical protein